MSRFCHETCVKEVEGNIFLSNRSKQSKMKCTTLRNIKLLTKDIHVIIIELYILGNIIAVMNNSINENQYFLLSINLRSSNNK